MTDATFPIEIPRTELAALCRKYGVRELSLFGSALRADFHPGSDLDLLVMFQPDAEIGFLEFAALQRELSSALGRPVDLVPKEGLKPIIRDDVIASARVVYAAP